MRMFKPRIIHRNRNVPIEEEQGPHVQPELGAEDRRKALTEQHRDGVENAANHCVIHNTLLHAPSIMVEITHPVQTAL